MPGDGLGDLFRSVGRRVGPLFAAAGKTLLKEGARVASDVMDGKDFKTSALSGLKRSGSSVLRDVVSSVRDGAPPPKKRKCKTKGRKIF